MNVVYDSGKLDMINYDANKVYSLDELVFYVPVGIINIKCFLIVSDGSVCDAINLKKSNSTSRMYFSYVCDMSTTLKIKSGKCKLNLLLIDEDTLEPKATTEDIEITIKNEMYNFKTKLCIIEKIDREIKQKYEDINKIYENMVSLTKLNIDVFSRAENETGGE